MFKNMRISKKLILSFVLATVIASIAGVISVVCMKNIDAKYSVNYVKYGVSQGDIGKALTAFCRIDGNVHDAVSYLTADDRMAANSNIKTQSEKMAGYFDAIEVNLMSDQSRQYFSAAKSAWESYQVKAAEILSAADSTSAPVITAAQQRLVDELDPLYLTIYNNLGDLMDKKVSDGNASSKELSSFAVGSITLAFVIIAVALVMGIALGVVISRGIANPVRACADRLRQLSEGDLESPVPAIDSTNEVGILADATRVITEGLKDIVDDVSYLLTEMGDGNFNIKTQAEQNYIGDFLPILTAMRAINTNLSQTLSQINQAADQVSGGSDQVSSGAQALSQGATEQASSIQELAATVTEISKQVSDTAANAQEASSATQQAGGQLESCNRQMEEMSAAMAQISDKSSEIGKIIKTIEDIAFQTNILALNAAVEAARAGAAGKGFAVVADEVRNLANKSQEASKNTSALIEDTVQAVQQGTRIAGETAQSLIDVVSGARLVTSVVGNIASAAEQQASAISQVTQGIDQISAVVQTNSATAEESAAASEELSSQALLLKQLVGQFRLKDDRTSTGTEAYRQEGGIETEYSFPVAAGAGKY